MDALPRVEALDADALLAGFVPTRRFAAVSLDSYQPDPRFPSQREALARMRGFASGLGTRGTRLKWWKKPKVGPRAIYLDGGYGVGKTHLLAATYHAAAGERFYLSFAELAYTIARLGMDAALKAFGTAAVVCIDEFELDDVAQTRMAAMFLKQLLERPRTHVVTTSNTLPSDLGQGRFAADAFQREIGDIAAAFEVVRIDGEDYRHRQWHELAHTTLHHAAPTDALEIDWTSLAEQLGQVHPVHYAQIAAQLDALHIEGLRTIQDQAVALRLVHFVDKLYDQEVRLSLSSEVALSDVFAPSYRHGGYEKKYRRCLSRLHELLAESESRVTASR